MEQSSEEKKYFELAKMAKKAGRHKDVVELLKELIKLRPNGRLSVQEYNLLNTAYKTLIEQKRISWRTIKNSFLTGENKTVTMSYQKQIEEEIREIIEEVLILLDNHKPNLTTDTKTEINYYKMKGDYHRYKAELTINVKERQDISVIANEAYIKGTAIATDKLDAKDRTRLGMALNYSVFLSEIKHDTDLAYQIAKKAFDDADMSIEDYSNYEASDSTIVIMQRLMENITLWNSSQNI